MLHALALWIATIFGAGPPPQLPAVAPAPAPAPAPTEWQTRCLAILDQLRVDAAAIEPEIRGAEVKIDDVREEVSLSIGPPFHDIGSLHIFVVHEPKHEQAWQRFAEPMNGLDHITWMRSTPTTDAAILLDGWETARARRLEPMLVREVEQCVAP